MTAVPANRPGLTVLPYRVGDYATFRRALLQARPGEQHLARWRPGARDDLAVQMLEWWAYVSDVLTLYTERALAEQLLRTAELPENLVRLLALLGYRPRPAVAADGHLAVLPSGPAPLVLPAGFVVRSVPGPGRAPQAFEVDRDTTVPADASADVEIAPSPALVTPVDGRDSLLLEGVLTTIAAGQRLLVAPRTGVVGAVPGTVAGVFPERGPGGARRTRIVFTGPLGLAATAAAADFRVLRSTVAVRPWPYPADAGVVITTGGVHLDMPARGTSTGDPVLLEHGATPVITEVLGYDESVWYGNGTKADPAQPPPAATPAVVPFAVLHGHLKLSLTPTVAQALDAGRAAVTVRLGWTDAGRPVPARQTVRAAGTDLVVVAGAGRPPLVAGAGQPVIVADGTGRGIAGTAVAAGPGALRVSQLTSEDVELSAPLRLLSGLVAVSRGETVRDELLGVGDASVAAQTFELARGPLIHVPEASAVGHRSTLRVRVGDQWWTEVPTFLDQPADARVYVTTTDERGRTRVLFGDGVEGARLPTGAPVRATYRHGVYAPPPPPGTLTVVGTPLRGLRALRHPVALRPGAPPEPPERIREYAPRSVLAFDRAVSADDYEAIAAAAPGVTRVLAVLRFDPASQRPAVTVHVGDDAAAVSAARTALGAAADPNRPLTVIRAEPFPISVTLLVAVGADRLPAPVGAEVRAAVAALFEPSRMGIGRSLYTSRILAAGARVAGVAAVRDLRISAGATALTAARVDPGPGRFLTLDQLTVTTFPEGAAG